MQHFAKKICLILDASFLNMKIKQTTHFILHNTKRLQYPHFQLHKSQQYTTPPLFLI
ncbi:hypothetical protein ACS0TY_027800 [Phlomoides rotata]